MTWGRSNYDVGPIKLWRGADQTMTWGWSNYDVGPIKLWRGADQTMTWGRSNCGNSVRSRSVNRLRNPRRQNLLYSYTSETKYKLQSNRMTQANRNNVQECLTANQRIHANYTKNRNLCLRPYASLITNNESADTKSHKEQASRTHYLTPDTVDTILRGNSIFWHMEKACGLQTLQLTYKNQNIGKMCNLRVCKEHNSW